MRSAQLGALIALAACATAGEKETERVRAHLERAEQHVRDRAPSDLTPAQQTRRTNALEHLRLYIEAERYPINDIVEYQSPIFVDASGTRCAVAELIEASGHGDLVARIANTRNLARVADLADEPQLVAWLSEHGLSLDEAARIQPSYSNTTKSTWEPTASVLGNLAFGRSGDGAQAAGGLGVRLGARRNTEPDGACDRCVYGSTSLAGEYRREWTDEGSTNLVSLLVEYELDRFADDRRHYLNGGPLLSIDGNDSPGDGFGGQFGYGFSTRGGDYPLFAELVLSAFTQTPGTVIRGALQLGAIW